MDKCRKCKIKWKINQKWIECDYCNAGFHIKCVNITADQFTYLSECDQSHWYCSICNDKMKELIGNLKSIEELTKKLEKTQQDNSTKIDKVINGENPKFISTVKEVVSARVDYQEGSEFVTTVKGITAEVIVDNEWDFSVEKTKNLIKDEMKEMNNRRRKENNIIIYGVTDDLMKKHMMRHHINPSIDGFLFHLFNYMNGDEDYLKDVESAEFIGKDPKPGCPLLVRFHTKRIRDCILKNANCLRDGDNFIDVYINKDLTKLQMKEQYALRKELRRRREMDLEENGFTNLIIHRGKITDRKDVKERGPYWGLSKRTTNSNSTSSNVND